MSNIYKTSRRNFITSTGLVGASASLAGILHSRKAPASVSSNAPRAPWGLKVGDVTADRAIVWSRSDQPARLQVEWDCDGSFRDPQRVRGPFALPATDNTARVDLTGLPPGQDVFLRVSFSALDGSRATGEVLEGRFRTPPERPRDIRFLWSGDTAGQGWGIDLDYGGMRIYEAMRQVQPDFFIHSGDTVYADGPMRDEVTDASGNVIWRNAFLDQVPAKRHVAQTLQDFRDNYLYNRYDEHLRLFSAEVPQIWQWDDHEVTNNWSDSKVLDGRYDPGQTIQALVARATRAFFEHAPLRSHSQEESERVYRHLPYGEDLDVFVIDKRSYRAANSCNVQEQAGPETVLMGRRQIEWLKNKLQESTATWKVIASDMPLGLVVGDGTDPDLGCPRGENSANGDGPVRGREFEIAEILSFIKHAGIDNVVWLTADVHYTAAHHYDPERAQFQDFEPFWEFVSGPLHAGSFGPNRLDDTFGPRVVFQAAPPDGQANLPPSDGLQFFGQVDIDSASKDMVVTLKDIEGAALFTKRLEAQSQCAEGRGRRRGERRRSRRGSRRR